MSLGDISVILQQRPRNQNLENHEHFDLIPRGWLCTKQS